MADFTQKQLDEAIEKAVDKATKKVGEDLAKISTKNTDLMGELKKARKRTKAFEDLDPDEVRLAIENAKRGEQKALEDKGDYEKALKLANENHAKTVKELTEKLDVSTSGEKTLRVRTAVDLAMDEIKVATHFKPAVRALMEGDISIVEQDGKPVAVVGDKSVSDHFKAWAETDDGKHYVGDGGQGGGGAGGGNRGGGGDNPWAKDTRNLSQQGIMERDNPAKAEQLKREAGVAA